MPDTPDYYCIVDDVNALVPQSPFSGTSRPSLATVATMITSIASFLDAKIGQIYVVPVVTGPVALQMLRDACAWGVLGRAQEARVTSTVPELHGTTSVWTKKFDAWLAHLIDPLDPLRLPDAPVNADDVPKVPSEILSGGGALAFGWGRDRADRPSRDQVF